MTACLAVTDKKMREGLDDAIAHWESNARAEIPDDAAVYGNSCALCKLFAIRPPIGRLLSPRQPCEGCPVADAAGCVGCGDTPYEDAAKAWRAWKAGDASREAFRVCARMELNFLRGVRTKLGDPP